MGSVCILQKQIKNKHLTSVVKIMVLCISAPCRDGEQIENEEDEKYLFSDDSSELTIRRVDKNDEAEYICIAENKAGEQDASIHLKVFGEDTGGQGLCSATIPLTLHTRSNSRALSALPRNLSQMQPLLTVFTTQGLVWAIFLLSWSTRRPPSRSLCLLIGPL